MTTQSTGAIRPKSVRDLPRATVNVLSASCLLESLLFVSDPAEAERVLIAVREGLHQAIADLSSEVDR